MGYRFTIAEKIGLRNLGVKFLGKSKEWHYGTYLFTVDFCADGMDVDTGFTEVAEEHKILFDWKMGSLLVNPITDACGMIKV
jgi:hypothetical protein